MDPVTQHLISSYLLMPVLTVDFRDCSLFYRTEKQTTQQ